MTAAPAIASASLSFIAWDAASAIISASASCSVIGWLAISWAASASPSDSSSGMREGRSAWPTWWVPAKECSASTTATSTLPSGTSGSWRTITSACSPKIAATSTVRLARSRASGEKSPCAVMLPPYVRSSCDISRRAASATDPESEG